MGRTTFVGHKIRTMYVETKLLTWSSTILPEFFLNWQLGLLSWATKAAGPLNIFLEDYELQNLCATAISLTCLVFPRKHQFQKLCWRSHMPEYMNNIRDFSKQDYSLLSISASRISSSGQHETLFIFSPLMKSLIALILMLFPVLKHYFILQSLRFQTWREVKTTLCQVQCSIHLSAGGLNRSGTEGSWGIRFSVSKILKSMNLLTWYCLWCQGCSRIC